MTLPGAFLSKPFAHRGLHDRRGGRVENSMAAIMAAVASGYGVELDVQASSDGVAMVFHDDDLDRLTARTGPVRALSAAALCELRLTGDHGTIPTLRAVLDAVAGRVPLLVEIKDQDGTMGPDIGSLQMAVAHDLATYAGPVALMSFSPHAVAELARVAPQIPRGLTTSAYEAQWWPQVPEDRRDTLREIPDYDRVGACFISHEATDLDRARVGALKAQGAAVLCWTIRSAKAEALARKVADNITFEGYLA